LLEGQAAQVGAPVPAWLRGQHELLADLLDHVVDQGLLVRHVAVQRHRPGPEPGRDRADGDRVQALGVGDGHGRLGHLPPGMPGPRAPAPALPWRVVRHRVSPPPGPAGRRAGRSILPGPVAASEPDCIIVPSTTYCVRDYVQREELMSIIEAVGLSKTFGAVTALDGLDLTVTAGRVCALLGPNGAGKTTAVRILATLTRPDGGRASVAGHDVVRHPGQVRAAIALAGQHAAVDDDLTGRENLVILGLMLHLGHRRARQRAAELLAEFDLAHAADRLVKTWSGGM